MKDMAPLMGSKYVQCRSYLSFEEIKGRAKNQKVLYIGTPCQAAALKAYVGNNENLTFCTLICHGVPSEKALKNYLNYISKTEKITPKYINFRDKSN